MVTTGGRADADGTAAAVRPAPARPPAIRQRPGTRLVLLTLAAAILLLGAATAGVLGYETIGRDLGSAAGAVTGPAPGR